MIRTLPLVTAALECVACEPGEHMMPALRRAVLLCTVLSSGACGSSTEQGPTDNLPAAGTGE